MASRAESKVKTETDIVDTLTPFADLADWITENRPDYDNDGSELQVEGWPYTISVGWLRRARKLRGCVAALNRVKS